MSTGDRISVPPFATTKQACERAEMIRSARLRKLRVFPDHGRDWPLWDDSEQYTVCPSDYGLSAQLTDRLRLWMDEWIALANAALRSDDQYEGAKVSSSWFDLGDEITREIAIEVWNTADVYPEFRRFF
ncbi:hypothetical protein G7067_05710 [Leucobacter insecticola]|uniref:Uncharacterized protein n=1 Tax=Leucobacter insecticola TaxID=2714934 RepID=A0A6G8FI30_9MICO|nr:hypothetical protein [Leucobacter insecticola]QIM16025.1 hypothetical protein G7067_05710 [Leucobacter insecticola]